MNIWTYVRSFVQPKLTSSTQSNAALDTAGTVITDITICFCSTPKTPCTCTHDLEHGGEWYRLNKDLLLHTSEKNAWLYIARAKEAQLTPDDLVLVAISVGKHLADDDSEGWERRPGEVRVQRRKYNGDFRRTVTGLDVLFGTDAVDSRHDWTLLQRPLLLNAPPDIPIARLTFRHGASKSGPGNSQSLLRVRDDGKFKIVQICDTHMVTGVGICEDAIDGDGQHLTPSEADPLTVGFIGKILDVEQPDLVILTGDQLHHNIPDSQSAIFKVLAPMIEREIPWAAVFGNHDDEGDYALSRQAQMAILQKLPFSLCEPGPSHVSGIGNYHLNILPPSPSKDPLATLFLLDSHGQIPSRTDNPDYKPIQQSQIDWFTSTSQSLRKERHNCGSSSSHHLSLAFMHIPLDKFGDPDLVLQSGHRREATEGPSVNTHFYDALVNEGVVAVGCGHDHVNDFCALLPRGNEESRGDGDEGLSMGPWLCYGGGTGFGGYGSYGGVRYHRRARVWDIDTNTKSLKTWKRVEYAPERVDELVLVERGVVKPVSAVCMCK